MRVVIFLSGHGSNMEAIVAAQERYKNYEVVGVVTNNVSCRGIQIAADLGLRIGAVPGEPGNGFSFDSRLMNVTEVMTPDLIVLAGYMKILSPWFVQNSCPIINIHPSLLPKFKGLHTHKRVLEAGETEHGITIHHVNEELDAGEIIFQKSLIINPNETEESLEARIHELEYEHYPAVISAYAKS